MSPALMELHEAHKARQARLGGKPYTPPPLPVLVQSPAPPAKVVKIPAPVDIPPTRKVQIMALSAAGYSQGRIARRLELTVGTVAGVLHRARAIEHKVLLADVVLALFKLGFDTYDIAVTIGEPEDEVCRALHRARDAERQA